MHNSRNNAPFPSPAHESFLGIVHPLFYVYQLNAYTKLQAESNLYLEQL